MRRAIGWILLAGVLGLPAAALAHQFAPALLELEETAPGRAAVTWKQPAIRVQGSRLLPVLPVECEGLGDPVVEREGLGLVARWEIECPDGLAGKRVGVEGIAASRADVLLRVALADGRRLSQVLTAEEPSFEIADDAGRLGVFESYTGLGVKHILSGWDHLLFVLALVLLIGWGRPLLTTVTAFTGGHSVTLALASLGLVRVPQAPIEAAIALSIFVLAVELVASKRSSGPTAGAPESPLAASHLLDVGAATPASSRLARSARLTPSRRADIRSLAPVASVRGKPTLTQRYPWVVAGGFGLLHGLGFAGALAQAGLPAGEIPLALFSFNVGIELGQLAFVTVALLAIAALARVPARWPAPAYALPGYAIGSFAIYWFLQRVAGLVASMS